ncbi:hypothetical protein K440DRAFT_630204 [Wilcoxina mikolae CBS 423.85]|nr:hypothetical protein K440DRAFT_630204 [Wilcoxina mikolae CBS 423.85]
MSADSKLEARCRAPRVAGPKTISSHSLPSLGVQRKVVRDPSKEAGYAGPYLASRIEVVARKLQRSLIK